MDVSFVPIGFVVHSTVNVKKLLIPVLLQRRKRSKSNSFIVHHIVCQGNNFCISDRSNSVLVHFVEFGRQFMQKLLPCCLCDVSVSEHLTLCKCTLLYDSYEL